MSQVPVVTTEHVQYGMKLLCADNNYRSVSWIQMNWTDSNRFDIGFLDGTIVRNSHPLTLWRLR